MSIVIQLFYYLIMTWSQIFISPIFWVVVFLVYLQYKKASRLEREILGSNKTPLFNKVFHATLYGFIGGIMGSGIILLLGIVIEAKDFLYILVMALLLMLVHPRFICFAYGGGIISIMSLIVGFPKINVSSVMAIIAILHLIESLLIYLDGDKNKIPIFIQREGKIVGGFNMIRYWPIPFIVLISASYTAIGSSVNMPEWWPLFNFEGSLQNPENVLFLMVPVMAALGYGDRAVTSYPKKKTRESARNLFLFSILLLILAVSSSYILVFKYIAALFSPLAHEFLIQYGRRKERKGKPIYTSTSKGLRVLDVMPGGIGAQLGLKPGDVIFQMNGRRIHFKREINEILMTAPSSICIDYYNIKKEVKKETYIDYKTRIKNLSILIVPNDQTYSYTVEERKSILTRIIEKVSNKDAGRHS